MGNDEIGKEISPRKPRAACAFGIKERNDYLFRSYPNKALFYDGIRPALYAAQVVDPRCSQAEERFRGDRLRRPLRQ